MRPTHTLRDLCLGLSLGLATAGCLRVAKWEPVPVTEAVMPQADRKLAVERHRLTLHGGRVLTGWLREVSTDSVTLQLRHHKDPNQFHVYPWDDIQSLEYRDENRQATIAVTATVWSLVGAGGAVAVLLALKGSCPFLYAETEDGERVLLGEGYSGAVGRVLQRPDLLRVPARADGVVDLVIANEAKENQRTDHVRLVTIDEPEGTEAVATHDARTLLIGAAVAPTRATSLAGEDVLPQVGVADSRYLETDMDAAVASREPALDEGVVLQFPASGGPTALVIDGANTIWADGVMGRYWATLGDVMPKLLDRMDDPDHPKAARSFRERAGLDLRVQVRRDGAWADAAVVPFLGWASTKRVAVPLPASEQAQDVRLVGGVGFWKFDRIVRAPIVDAAPEQTVHAPVSALTGDRDDRRALAAADGVTSDLPQMGDETAVRFELDPTTARHAAFLHIEGHYIPYPPPQPHKQLAVARGVAVHPERVREMSIELWRATRALMARADGAVAR